MLRFIWDQAKAEANARKHGVKFPEAATAFGDPAPAWPARPNVDSMKKKTRPAEPVSAMRAEYDFAGAVRGKYAQGFAEGTNVVVLDPDVADVFGDSKAVNDALRVLARSVRKKREPVP